MIRAAVSDQSQCRSRRMPDGVFWRPRSAVLLQPTSLLQHLPAVQQRFLASAPATKDRHDFDATPVACPRVMSPVLTRRELVTLSSLEAERGLLYALLVGRGGAVVPDLDSNVFTVHSHRLIYEAIRDLLANGEVVAPLTVARRLQQRGEMEAAGGPAALSELTESSSWSGSVESCAQILRDCARRLDLAQIGQRITLEATTMGGDPEAALRSAQARAGEEGATQLCDDRLSFPETAWRGVFNSYREAMHGTTEAPDCAHFATLWAVAAVRLGRRTWFYSGERIYPNVYLCEYGASGDKKTTAERRAFNCRLLPIAGVKIIRNVGSTEGLADKLHGTDGCGSFLFWEELSSLLARGRWAGSTILEFLTETFDCPAEWGLSYRKSPVQLLQPTPTVLCATTTEWFWKSALPEDFYGGFGNRFLFLTGPKKAPIPEPHEPDQLALEEVRTAMEYISEIPETMARFQPDARRLWEEFYTTIESEHRPGLIAAALKREHVYTRKLCLTYAALERTLPDVTLPQLQAAIAVSLYAARCTQLLIDGQARKSTMDGDIEERFTTWVKKNEGAKVRYMQQTMSKYVTCEIFNRVLLNLTRAGVIEVRLGDRGSKRLYPGG